jgi:hypothetical protein
MIKRSSWRLWYQVQHSSPLSCVVIQAQIDHESHVSTLKLKAEVDLAQGIMGANKAAETR